MALWCKEVQVDNLIFQGVSKQDQHRKIKIGRLTKDTFMQEH